MSEQTNLSFEGQREDENVVLLRRQHPWVLVRTGLAVVAIIFISLIPLLLPGGGKGLKFIALGVSIALVIALARLYMWWHTIYVVSNHRVIGVEQQKMLLRQVSEVPLENIQNITQVKKGFGPNVFDFGDLQIQTSGSKIAMEISSVDNPLETQQKILDAARKIKS
ncbi:MAG TPA: PH domain-containing protein [Patescibacteria group bacterium]|nr:PH domain-containing protein [Patescibacteria group bacterium]